MGAESEDPVLPEDYDISPTGLYTWKMRFNFWMQVFASGLVVGIGGGIGFFMIFLAGLIVVLWKLSIIIRIFIQWPYFLWACKPRLEHGYIQYLW